MRVKVLVEKFQNPRPGETFHIDSGLGGSFAVAFKKKDGEKLLFACKSSGWPYAYLLTPEEAAERLSQSTPNRKERR